MMQIYTHHHYFYRQMHGLIDTELAWEIDENFERRAEYFIAEGLCYFVPSEKTS